MIDCQSKPYPSPDLRPKLAVDQDLRGVGQLLPAAVRAPQLEGQEGPLLVGHLPGMYIFETTLHPMDHTNQA